MSKKSEKALELSGSGLNCAQSVFAVFCEDYGVSLEQGLRLCGGFGGGVRCGEICGAVSGAVMVIGLKYGNSLAEDKEAKALCGAKTIEFTKAFRAKCGFLTCKELLGCDVSTEEGKALADKGTFKATCAGLIKNAVLLLEELEY